MLGTIWWASQGLRMVSAKQGTQLPYSAVQCGSVQCSAVQCSTVQSRSKGRERCRSRSRPADVTGEQSARVTCGGPVDGKEVWSGCLVGWVGARPVEQRGCQWGIWTRGMVVMLPSSSSSSVAAEKKKVWFRYLNDGAAKYRRGARWWLVVVVKGTPNSYRG